MPDPAACLTAVREAITKAARSVGRDPSEITLIAVSKGRSADQVEALIAAGQRDFGENRVADTATKWPDLRARYPDVRVHMIGQLQSNKAAEAAALFDSIHSLDRPSLLDALVRAGWTGSTYVQVDIGDEDQKGGVGTSALPAFLAAVAASPLRLDGLMAIPPAGVEAAPYFALLAKLARRHGVGGLSMGMSGDFEAAVKLGATAVRVGTALFD